MKLSSSQILAALSTVSLGAVALAVTLQYTLGMQPCPWCVLQRLEFTVVGLLSLLALLCSSTLFRKMLCAGVMGVAACGVATALWQHFVAAKSSSCAFTFADKVLSGMRLDSVWPAVFEPKASCADAAVNLLGLPFEVWSLALFVAVAAGAVQVLRSKR